MANLVDPKQIDLEKLYSLLETKYSLSNLLNNQIITVGSLYEFNHLENLNEIPAGILVQVKGPVEVEYYIYEKNPTNLRQVFIEETQQPGTSVEWGDI